MRRQGDTVFIGDYTLRFNKGQIEVLQGIMPLAELTIGVNLAVVTSRKAMGSLNIHLYMLGIAKPFLTKDDRVEVLKTAAAVEEYIKLKLMELIAIKQTITTKDIALNINPPYGHRVSVKQTELYGIA